MKSILDRLQAMEMLMPSMVTVIYPDGTQTVVEALEAFSIRDVNRTVVLPQEKLSDNAYIYRKSAHAISQVTLKNPEDSTCE